MGPEKKSRVVTAEDNKITAYHESGHAILAIELEHCNSLHEVSIISRGWAAGYTMTLPKVDLHHTLKSHLLDEICMTMGGRVAEKVAFTDVSTGAIQDLKQASEIARKMVEEYGMSDAVGPVFVGGDTEVFIAKDWGHSKNYSEALAAKIDARTMSAYTRIRQSVHNHLAVVPVFNGDSCGGCFNTVTPQRLIEIASGKKLVICEHCGRIIVNPNAE